MNVARAKRNDGKCVDQNGPLPNYIFSGEDFGSRVEMWEARDYDVFFKLGKKPHASEPYHKGCPTLYPLSFSSPERLKIADMIAKADHRDMDSLFDETISYWKNLATTEEVRSVRKDSMNSAYHLLKHIGCHWTNVLELISHTLAQSEYFSDYNPATRPKHMSTAEWRRGCYNVVEASHKINYFRRRMIYFEANMALNLERLGTSLDCDLQIDDAPKLPRTLSDAQRDFKVLASRLRPLRERAYNLSTVAKDIALLRAAFQATEDGANGLSLSLLAMVIFPFTLVASMFSMADNFKPGNSQFWLFFAVSIPLSAVIILFLTLNQNWEYWRNYGTRTLHSIIERKDSRAKDKDGAQMKSMELPL
jgi:Mg2+ and Co2+ transporter CorA